MLFKKKEKNSKKINILNRKKLNKNKKKEIESLVIESIKENKDFKDIAIEISLKYNLGIVQVYQRGNIIDIVI